MLDKNLVHVPKHKNLVHVPTHKNLVHVPTRYVCNKFI
jgi:hypothetical protein